MTKGAIQFVQEQLHKPTLLSIPNGVLELDIYLFIYLFIKQVTSALAHFNSNSYLIKIYIKIK